MSESNPGAPDRQQGGSVPSQAERDAARSRASAHVARDASEAAVRQAQAAQQRSQAARSTS